MAVERKKEKKNIKATLQASGLSNEENGSTMTKMEKTGLQLIIS